MSAQPELHTRLETTPPAVRGNHLRILPIPHNEPTPLPQGSSPAALETGFVQGSLAVDFRREGQDQFFGPQSTARQDLPDPHQWARRLVAAIFESMDGVRPAEQLNRWVAPDIRDRIARRGVVARQQHRRPGGAVQVRALRVCEPVDGVAEVAAVIAYRSRVRALALRMSGVDGRWLITALELG